MRRNLTEVAAELQALDVVDFDVMRLDANGSEQLDAICTELAGRDDPQQWAPLLYAFMEHLDTADLGSPGPLVHTLEAWRGYRPLLVESMRRKPTPLTVWMANRVLNGNPSDAPQWRQLLREATSHPLASPHVQADARGFLEYQATRS
ncbi:hypothetical protein AB0869_16610 [Micromonospora vinacea]|uniref:hypothetical protein n=1 Tax=Micromonospora vinacea TaxID=709878 RepID=UPI003451B485